MRRTDDRYQTGESESKGCVPCVVRSSVECGRPADNGPVSGQGGQGTGSVPDRYSGGWESGVPRGDSSGCGSRRAEEPGTSIRTRFGGGQEEQRNCVASCLFRGLATGPRIRTGACCTGALVLSQ